MGGESRVEVGWGEVSWEGEGETDGDVGSSLRWDWRRTIFCKDAQNLRKRCDVRKMLSFGSASPH